jgi:hypothetical protein
MISLALGFALAMTPMQTPTVSTDPVTISHVYALTDDDKYTLDVKLDMGGSAEMSADLEEKVDKLDGKKAAVTITATNFKSDMGDGTTPDPFKDTLDEHHVGTHLAHEADLVYSVFEVMSVAPAKPLKAGDSYMVELTLDEGTISESGKMVEIKDVDGRRIASIEATSTVAPASGNPATLKIKKQVDVATGKVVKAQADLDMGNGTGTITLDAKKS